jgi:hypothetical protein
LRPRPSGPPQAPLRRSPLRPSPCQTPTTGTSPLSPTPRSPMHASFCASPGSYRSGRPRSPLQPSPSECMTWIMWEDGVEDLVPTAQVCARHASEVSERASATVSEYDFRALHDHSDTDRSTAGRRLKPCIARGVCYGNRGRHAIHDVVTGQRHNAGR